MLKYRYLEQTLSEVRSPLDPRDMDGQKLEVRLWLGLLDMGAQKLQWLVM